MKKLFKRIGFFMVAVGMMLMFSMRVQAASTPNWNDNVCYGTGNPLSAGYKYSCTWYVWGRTREVLGIRLSSFTSEYVNSSVTGGYTTTPSTHSIAVYTNSSGKILHVAFIENYDGTNVSYSEGNAGSLGTGVQNYHAATYTLSVFTSITIKRVGKGCTTVKYIPLVKGSDSTPPVVSNKKVTNLSANGFTVSCTVTDNVAVSYVDFLVWPNANGEWQPERKRATLSGNTASYNIKTSEHNEYEGDYAVHVEAYDTSGNKTYAYFNWIHVDKTKPVIQNLRITAATANSYTVRWEVIEDVGLSWVKVAAIDWEKGWDSTLKEATKVSGNTWEYEFKGLTAGKRYQVDVYACDTSNNWGRCFGQAYILTGCTNVKGHSWSKTKVVQPTCTSAGYSIYTCSGCGTTKTGDNVSATGHKVVTDSAAAATCTTSGKTAGSHCSACGKVIVAQTTIAATGNHSKTTTVSKKATTTINGRKTMKCSTCGKTLSTEIINTASIVKLSATSYTYNGKVKNPTVIIKDSEGNTISSKNYTLIKASGRKKVGKYTYKIKFKNEYSGTKTLTFKINPKATSLTSVSRSKKAFTVKWNKISAQASGYEIMYATNSSFTKNKKTVTVSSYKTTSKKITGLKSNTKYYVKVRTYKTVDGVKYYSSWSKAKTVTTK